jgi:hypothetical protein
MRPVSKTVPFGSVSMKRPPSRGSKASSPGERGVNRNSVLGTHQIPMSRMNIWKARG